MKFAVMYKRFGKRILDIVLSVLLLCITSPLIIFALLILTFQNRGRPFFFQERPGLGLQTFRIVKFKTMNDKRDLRGDLLPDNLRLTFFGKWIRKLSIDELPQLFNVLLGEMSLVGPRPLLKKYILLYSIEQLRRHEVRPGITGWAQVNGRNSISWTKKFIFDVYYIENLSLIFDIKIIFLTALKIIQRKGINQTADRPMEPFNGKN